MLDGARPTAQQGNHTHAHTLARCVYARVFRCVQRVVMPVAGHSTIADLAADGKTEKNIKTSFSPL